METQFNDLSVPDPNVKYYCAPNVRSKGFTHLMKLVLMVREYPKAMRIIEKIIGDEANKRNKKGWTALMIACANSETYSNNSVVKMLINAREDLDIRYDLGGIALSIVLKSHNVKTIKILIKAEINIIIKRDRKRDPMMDVCRILSHNRQLFRENIFDVKAYVCKKVYDAVKMLINSGTKANYVSDYGFTALLVACSWSINDDNIKLIKLLIDAGADVNQCNTEGQYPLVVALDNVRIMQLLIDSGADVNIKYRQADTILMIILQKESLDDYVDIIIDLLYKSQETILHKDMYKKTAYDYYIKKGHNILDKYHLKILKGDISPNNTKSARLC